MRPLVVLTAIFLTLLLVFNVYSAINGIFVKTGKEKTESYAEAVKLRNEIESSAIENNGIIKSLEIDNENTVRFSVANADDGFTYGSGTLWFVWPLLFFELFSLFFLWKVSRKPKVKSVNQISNQSAFAVITSNRATYNGKIGNGTAKYRGYEAKIIQEITLPRETAGIIAMRDWNLEKGKLFSLITHSEWTGNSVIADKLPKPDNNNGIYAYQLGRRTTSYQGEVTGIVALYGKCQVGQKEGIIRAECCHILCLITDTYGRELSKRYGVPVFITSVDDDYLEKWLISDEGIHWLRHNNELLKALTTKAVDPIKQIEEILRNEKF